ncbi:MAG: YerC/YecD family TrpR-related protein [Anaerovoracaceae bacterium]|nr:YerC/YecD family TrpR-related protein [Bacillota bacterium]MDY2670257.1 YerC/YecD family TrpR-related protein [Anaerovoracaceae bacterium]
MSYETKLKSDETDELFSSILTLDSLEDCYRFFEDLCTVKEIHAMAQRFEVAKLLIEHRTYSEIESETGASTATISRINRTLQYGADGYRRVIGSQDK